MGMSLTHRVLGPLAPRSASLAGAAALVALTLAAGGAAATSKPVAKPPKGVPVAPSIVAQAVGRRVAVYKSPTAKHIYVTLPSPNADGGPLVFLVKSRVPGWEQVYLPQRPNESTGWVKDSSVNLSLDPYFVQVLLSAHRVRVWRTGKLVRTITVGVGRSALPTPAGRFYIVELLQQSDPNGAYGPYAFGLSAFSDVLYSFGGGPGEVGMHGTNEPNLLGTNVSHGCIRMSNANITALAHMLPLGTPVQIIR